MVHLSVVIVCRDEAEQIASCLAAACRVSQDVIVIDTGSKDKTLEIAHSYPVRLYQWQWQGYGATKNKAHAIAQNDWILSLDGDECMDTSLVQSLQQWSPESDRSVGQICRINHIGERAIRFGYLHPERKARVFHRKHYKWDNAQVHESLIPTPQHTQLLIGKLRHYPAKSLEEISNKLAYYESLKSKRGNLWRSIFHFCKSYFWQGGFLEGRLGWKLSLALARAKMR